MWVFAGGGVVVVVVLAIAIGRAVDQAARVEAWTRVAASRRINHEFHHELEQLVVALSVREHVLEAREQRLDVRESLLLHREAELLAAEDRPPDPTI